MKFLMLVSMAMSWHFRYYSAVSALCAVSGSPASFIEFVADPCISTFASLSALSFPSIPLCALINLISVDAPFVVLLVIIYVYRSRYGSSSNYYNY